MKTIAYKVQNWVLRCVFLMTLACLSEYSATAQTLNVLYSFRATGDGANPPAGVTLSGNTVYGTTQSAGTNSSGTLFSVGTNGQGFQVLHSFTATDTTGLNSDGFGPFSALIVSGSNIYGTAEYGGANGYGTIYKLNTDGSGFVTIYSFSGGDDGAFPNASLILEGNTLYGTTAYGGTTGNGVVFAIDTDGSNLRTLHSFSGLDTTAANGDGANPNAALILSGGTLFGTAYSGGASGNGTIFSVNTNGSAFATLHSFAAVVGAFYTNSDGANPSAGLVLSGGTLFGTAYDGGASGNGTVFSINTNGSSFVTLHSFTALNGTFSTNSDGAYPSVALAFSGGKFYGVTSIGGSFGNGTAFSLGTNGTDFSVFYNFAESGFSPDGPLAATNTILYGSSFGGGAFGAGSVYEILQSGYQIFGFVMDSSSNAVAGVTVYADNGMGDIQSATTSNDGYYSLNVTNGTWSIYMDCSQLADEAYGCPATQTAVVSGANVEREIVLPNNCLALVSTNLPTGTLNNFYDAFLQATNCASGLSWALNGGSLPPGLQMNSDGEISGLPTANGTFDFSVLVTNSNGDSVIGSLAITIVPVVSLPGSAASGHFQFNINGSAGHCYTIRFSTNLVDWRTLMVTNLTSYQAASLVFPTTNRSGFYQIYDSGVTVSESLVSFGTGIGGLPVFYANFTNGVVVIPITRSTGLSNAVCLNYWTSGGTANAGCDYGPVSGVLCFPAGVASNSFSIPLATPCSTNQSVTVGLHVSDTNGNNVVNTYLVIQRPPPILVVGPANILALVTPLDDPCAPAMCVISNAGPPGSCLNYHVSVTNLNQSQYLTINGNPGASGDGGSLYSGQSVTESIYVPQEFYYVGGTNQPAYFDNTNIPLQIQALGVESIPDAEVTVGLTNTFSLLVGTWGGSCSAGQVSGLWSLDVLDTYAPGSGTRQTDSVFTFQGTIPYYTTNGILRSVGQTWQFLISTQDIYACDNVQAVYILSLPFAAPTDVRPGGGPWTLQCYIPMDVLSGKVVDGTSYHTNCFNFFSELGGTGKLYGSRISGGQ